MKKVFILTTLLISGLKAQAEFSKNDIVYYIGTGKDTAFCVVNFNDGTKDSTYAWGFLFDASETTTAETMLTAIGNDEPKISFVMAGGFLNDIIYNGHEGLSGDPDYWSTWSKTSSTPWTMNTGINEVLANGDWYGCSYTDFSPAIEPGEPIAAYSSQKFTKNDVQFWIGSGSDSAVFVADFVEGSGEQVSYAWGYLFDGSTDGKTMLNDISAADANISINTGSGFLDDIFFNKLSGKAGNPHYWGTFSGTNLSDWILNSGLNTTINNGDWFGCTYAAWEPRRPFYPSPALDSAAFTIQSFNETGLLFVGDGKDTALIVIDFNEAKAGESFAFGYLFNDSASAETALMDLSRGDMFNAEMSSGFLNDITHYPFEGIGGSPNYWSTWSAKNNGGWSLNAGISEMIKNRDWFGCSYSAWSPATFPSTPTSSTVFSSLTEIEKSLFVYPNPTRGIIVLTDQQNTSLQVIDLSGRIVLEKEILSNQETINLTALPNGIYSLVTANGVSKIVKQ